MELGIYTFGDLDSRTGAGAASPGQRIRDILERVRLAEDVGLAYAGIGEHHRTDYAISSPATVIAAALAQTDRIHVGSAVTVLSTEDPVRVFQQFATMDQFSGGRVELLAGRGSFIESFPLFGANLEDYDELYEEKLDLLLALDRENPITWSGRFRPPLIDANILPRPTDKPALGPHLRIGVATGGSPASSVRAGKLGLPINYAVIGGEPRRFAPLVDLYRQAHARAGHPASSRTVSVSVHGFVADDDATAMEFFYPYQLDAGTKIARERGFALPNRISYEMQSSRHGAYFIGSPETVAEKIVLLHRDLGHDRQNFQMDVSGVPQRESLRAIELLGAKVLPMVTAELGR
ncbi:LLM class flavin-dependent oxidoreductase [Georgenia sp. SYP-B2076]|uniref:LLM class flavin-dependent oxidoreductase n=1 Tax=Georgenia sp. SYP-B2076 TaxID=2495881 RepID=UPI000F8D4309|nr:LLM class flavin-dependent oxidoreductase [Georgenia sp. SYP-B2076]